MPKYTIAAGNYPRLQAEVEKVNKRADKLGYPPITLRLLETRYEKKHNKVLDFDYDSPYLVVELEGQPIQLQGWRLVAVIEKISSTDNFVREIPGQSCPAEYLTTNVYHCDHCNTVRKRNEVYILTNEVGEYKQVGRSCLQDFLHGARPHDLVKRAEQVCHVYDLTERAQKGEWLTPTTVDESGVPTTEFVAVVSVLMRCVGWISKGEAFKDRKQCTADIAWLICNQPESVQVQQYLRDHPLQAYDDDLKIASEALDWAKGLSNNSGSTYLYDLGVACRQPYVVPKMKNFLGSVLVAYRRRQEELKSSQAEGGQFVGEEKKRQTFERLKVEMVRQYETDFGIKIVVKFTDEHNNALVWHTSTQPDWVKEGEVIDVVATVKKHVVYKGQQQTEIQRVVPNSSAIQTESVS